MLVYGKSYAVYNFEQRTAKLAMSWKR